MCKAVNILDTNVLDFNDKLTKLQVIVGKDSYKEILKLNNGKHPHIVRTNEIVFHTQDSEEIFERGCQAITNGLSLAIHAIGDRANHEMLNAFEQIQKFETTLENHEKLRHRIEHVQLTHPEDAPRLSKLGVIASMQPIHVISDMKIAEECWGDRAAYSYAWRTQLQNGAQLAFGSDAPVESPNPFWGLHAAVTRQWPDGFPGPEGWYPEQCLTIQEAIRAYTIGPAYAAGLENQLGKLTPGYLADLLVLEEDPFTCDLAILRKLKPSRVMIGGDWVIK